MNVKLPYNINPPAALLLVGAVAIGIYFTFFFSVEKKLLNARDMPTDIVTMTGLPEGTGVTATLNMNGKISPVSFMENRLALTPQQQKIFQLPYVLKASVQYPDGTYRDFSWSMGETGAKYRILADGFSPDDRITLRIEESTAEANTPFDWSGRLEFAIVLEVIYDATACIDIFESAPNRTITLCHFNPGRKQG